MDDSRYTHKGLDSSFDCDQKLVHRTFGTMSGLANGVARELDFYRLGRSEGTMCIDTLVRVLDNHLRLTETSSFPNLALVNTLKGFSEKEEMKTVEEYRLNVRLLQAELRDYETLPLERLEDVRDFCNALSRNLCAYEDVSPYRLVG